MIIRITVIVTVDRSGFIFPSGENSLLWRRQQSGLDERGMG
jgi:hypothetical protein